MKIVFILETIDAPRMLKRIQEFIDNNYEVEVYGFKHFREKSLNQPTNFKINVIGEVNQANYLLRIKGIIKGIKKVLNATKGQDVLYYIPNLDVAMFFRLLSRANYVFEESDLKHTYVHSRLVQSVLERIDKKVIRKSVVSAFTSEGFVKYHFGDNQPANICYVFNRLNAKILDLPIPESRDVNMTNIKFGFVGKATFRAIFDFAKIIAEKYPEHEMHFYGTADASFETRVNELSKHPNFFMHGRFKNPDELPQIYNNVDLVLALYDVDAINVLYAEPNKLYEAMYYRKPIIVSKGTYLAEKVNRLGIGYEVDSTNLANIDAFISGLTKLSIKERIDKAEKIDRKEAVNDNSELFKHIKDYTCKK